MKQTELQRALTDYHRLGEVQKLSQADAQRISEQPRLVSRFYDVVTRFYEYGWGDDVSLLPAAARGRVCASRSGGRTWGSANCFG